MTTQQPHASALAYAAWSRITEPEDTWARAIIELLGPAESWAWLKQSAMKGERPQDQAAYLLALMPGEVHPHSQRALVQAVERWSRRAVDCDPVADLDVMYELGGQILTPHDASWPGLFEPTDDFIPPICLWVRGDAETLTTPAVAVVGARAASPYGEYVTAQIVEGIADRRLTVISGGAYGIDAVAHRGALASQAPTVAVLAGGVNKYYPAGNSRMFEDILESGGAIVSEMPPGAAPRRVRFLQRNRLIAALGEATVVTEAAWRSGALSTAQRAAALCRPVGAVPGPVTSAASAGCHRLMREGVAVCVTSAGEVVELLPGREPHMNDQVVSESEWRPTDVVDAAIWDAMPIQSGTHVDRLARIAGRTDTEVLAALSRLELIGKVSQANGKWRRARSKPVRR